jgi:hypothetical protein
MENAKSESKSESEVLVDILTKLGTIEARLDLMDTKIKEMNKSCTSMDNHIGFVENVYSSLKSPLNYLANMVTSTEELPAYPEEVRVIRSNVEDRALFLENKK